MAESTPEDATDKRASVNASASGSDDSLDSNGQVVPSNIPLSRPGGHLPQVVEGVVVDRPLQVPHRDNRRLLSALLLTIVLLLLAVGVLIVLLLHQRTITAAPSSSPSPSPSHTPSAVPTPSNGISPGPSPATASPNPSPTVGDTSTASPLPSPGASVPVGGFGPYFFSDLDPVGRSAAYKTGSASFGSANYPHTVSMYCNGNVSSLDYNVGGRTGTLTGTFGVSNDTPFAVGQTATVTFYDQDRNQIGAAKSLSLGHPVTFKATVKASVVRLRVSCTSTGGFYVSLGDLQMAP